MEEQFRPEAQCKYHSECDLYNQGVLSLQVEMQMCGRGIPVHQDYLPLTPKSLDFQPAKSYEGGSEPKVCSAYELYKLENLVGQLVTHLYQIKEVLDEKGFW